MLNVVAPVTTALANVLAAVVIGTAMLTNVAIEPMVNVSADGSI